MYIGIFDKFNYVPMCYFREGVLACGDSLTVQNPHVWYEDQAQSFDVVVIYGAKHGMLRVKEYYQRIGTPVVVVEQGHIHREKYWQAGWENINWLPVEGDANRLKKLRLKTIKKPQENTEGNIVVLGQVSGDAQHEIADMIEWAEWILSHIREFTNKKVTYRSHPKEVDKAPKGYDEYHHPELITLKDSFISSCALVTYNSNAGLLALIQGYRVFSEKKALYQNDWDVLCQNSFTEMSQVNVPRPYLFFPEEYNKDLTDLLERVSCAQWNQQELESGEAWKFLKGEMPHV